jgi:putative ABC transport system permease protein
MMEFRPIISTLLRNKVAPFLVAVQIAISLAILTNALYIIQLRLDTASRPSGLKDEHSTFSIAISSNRQLSTQEKLDQDARFYQVISAVPGVVGVADVNEMPMSQSGTYTSISLDLAQTKLTAETTIYASAHSVIKAFGLNLIAGRDFTEADVEQVDPNALTPEPVHSIITEALARQLYPDAHDMSSVIGKRFYWGVGSDSTPTQIVGVVERLQTPNASAKEKGSYSTLVPKRRLSTFPIYAVQTEAGQRDRVMAEVESALRKSDALPVNIKSKTTDEDRKTRYGREMTMAWMLIFVSVLLVIITCSGIVGMTSLWVSQRKKQIGVRRALGARKIDILRYFITENLIISCTGVVSGALMAVGLNEFLVSQLELTKMPPQYILLGALAFVLLGLGAAYAPSWRAAGISPAVATRST